MKKALLTVFFAALFCLPGSLPLSAQDNDAQNKKLIAKMDSLRNAIAASRQRREVPAETVMKDTVEITSVEVPAAREIRPILPAERLLAEADSLRRVYDFPEAVAAYNAAIEACADSTERLRYEDELVLGENGLSMMDYCNLPRVVARQKFSVRDFFLFYPLQDNGWRAIPNQLDSSGTDGIVRALYLPDDATTIFYSAQDKEGIRNIYTSHFQDTLWTAPELINESLTSSSDEIYPMVSPDRKTLYFASKGLYGMGGYDLYSSTYNSETGDWETPVNMGFPFSSPYDDFLFMDTDDGKYSIFASNRNCARDSVCLYVVEYDAMPVRKQISNVEELRTLASMMPRRALSRIDNSSVATESSNSEETRRYITQMNRVRELRDSLNNVFSSDQFLTELPEIQARLDSAVKALQETEMEFLQKGIALDPEKIQKDLERQVVGASSGYTFTKHHPGAEISLDMAEPVVLFDYTFKILPEAQFAQDNTLPDGLVYQIQLFSLSKKATLQQLKGLSPVFEKEVSSTKHTYSVGIFRTYSDVLSNLNSVKRLGFKNAIITAYLDGKTVSVGNARAMESNMKTQYKIRIYPDGASLPKEAVTALRTMTTADIIRLTEDGSIIFEVGPIDNKESADAIVQVLKAEGVSNVSIIDLGKSL